MQISILPIYFRHSEA